MPLFLGKHSIVFGKQRGFFRKHSLFLGTGSYALGNTKSEIGKHFTHFWHLGLLGERAE